MFPPCLYCSVPRDDIAMKRNKPWRGGCQRGSKLCKYIVSLFSKPDDTIIYLFAGPRTLGLVAGILEHNVIMIDEDEHIYEKMLEPYSLRYSEHVDINNEIYLGFHVID